MFYTRKVELYPESKGQQLRHDWWKQIRSRQIVNLQKNVRAHYQHEDSNELAKIRAIQHSQSIIINKNQNSKKQTNCLFCEQYLSNQSMNQNDELQLQKLQTFVNFHSKICSQHFKQLLQTGYSLYVKHPDLPALLYENAQITKFSQNCLKFYLLFMGQVLCTISGHQNFQNKGAIRYGLQNFHLNSLLDGQIQYRILELEEQNKNQEKSTSNQIVLRSLWKLCRNAVIALEIITPPVQILREMLDSDDENDCIIATTAIIKYIHSLRQQNDSKLTIAHHMIGQLTVNYILFRKSIKSVQLKCVQIELVSSIINSNSTQYTANQGQTYNINLSQYLQPSCSIVMEWVTNLDLLYSSVSQQSAQHVWNMIQQIKVWAHITITKSQNIDTKMQE